MRGLGQLARNTVAGTGKTLSDAGQALRGNAEPLGEDLAGMAEMLNPATLVKHPDYLWKGAQDPEIFAQGIGTGAMAVAPFMKGTGAGEAASGMRNAMGQLSSKTAGMIARHPAATTIGTGGAGMLLGRIFEGGAGGGEPLGEVGGGYLGLRSGDVIVRAAENKMIEDAIQGKIPPEALPHRLVPKFRQQRDATASAYARLALERGETPEMIAMPSGIQRTAQRMYEERVRMTPKDPFRIVTPQEDAAEAFRAARARQATGRYQTMARLRGMQQAAGEAEPEYVPSKRGVTTTVTRSSRLLPKLPER